MIEELWIKTSAGDTGHVLDEAYDLVIILR
jgi:hypothetical protein